MIAELKLYLLLEFHIWKRYDEGKTVDRWYYNYHSGQIKTAFTLAEVLITLLIIGVVASLVIPSLIADTQQAEFKTAWKKEYSVVSQAFQRILTDNGGSLKGVCPSVGWHEDSRCIMNTFQPYLNINRYCLETSATNDTCWHSYSPASVHNLNGTDQIFWSNFYPALILNDGTLLSFQGGKSDCSSNDDGVYNRCIFIVVDVNGFKGPNILGKDIFAIHIFANKITPYGYNDGYTIDCNTDPPSGEGFGCSVQYLKE